MDKLMKKLVNKETMSYLVFGVLTTVVDFVVYALCTSLSVNYLVANVIAWCVAVVFAYITNKLFVFNSKSMKAEVLLSEIPSFVGARIFSLLFSLVFIYMTVTIMGSNKLVAKIISAIFVVIMNYLLSKLIIFKEREEEEKKTLWEKLKENSAYIFAFLIPLAIIIYVYYKRKIYPFGDNMYLRSDCYHQYAPFMKEFYRRITEGESLVYSWNIGLGVNFSALYAYYLASPLNWFVGLVSPNHIIEVMNVFIILKLALCSVTFTYYIRKHYENNRLGTAVFGIFYALSSYVAAFSWNLMWLDCLLLLPLIILGLERLVKKNKCFLYCITLGLAILSNYYIAIMICIYCVLYFAVLILTNDDKKGFKYYKQKIGNFALYSFLAGTFAAVTVLPAYTALSSTISGEFEFPKKLSNYFSVLDMMSRSLMKVEPAIFEAHDPNLYCTVAVFLLVPLYLINKKIKHKEKVGKVVLLAIFLVSFSTNIPNYIWHGFHFPNSLPARQSFIYMFLLLTICYESMLYIKELATRQIGFTFAGAVALVLLIEELYVGEKYNHMIIYLSITFILFYLIVIALLRNANYKKNFVVYLLLVVVTAEAYISTEASAFKTSVRSDYLKDNNAITEILDTAKQEDDSFYRVEKHSRRTKNDAAWNNYHGASTFSSTANAGVSEFYGAMGMEKSANAYAYYGHTPLTEAILSIKYVIYNSFVDDTEYRSLFTSSVDNSDVKYLYKNNYVLPLGFMLPSGMDDLWDISNSDPFEVQNDFCMFSTGTADPMFVRLPVDTMDMTNTVNITEDGTNLYIYITSSLDAVSVNVTKADGTIETKSYDSMTHRHILELGKFNAGDAVSITSTDDDVPDIQLYAYSLDNNVFDTIFNKLNESVMEITSFKETEVKAKVNAENDGLMFTSIPYDKGWTVFVDGKEVKTKAFKDAFLSFEVPSGEHTIKLEYNSAGLKFGLSLTALSNITFLGIVAAEVLKRKKMAEEKKKHDKDNKGNNDVETE